MSVPSIVLGSVFFAAVLVVVLSVLLVSLPTVFRLLAVSGIALIMVLAAALALSFIIPVAVLILVSGTIAFFVSEAKRKERRRRRTSRS